MLAACSLAWLVALVQLAARADWVQIPQHHQDHLRPTQEDILTPPLEHPRNQHTQDARKHNLHHDTIDPRDNPRKHDHHQTQDQRTSTDLFDSVDSRDIKRRQPPKSNQNLLVDRISLDREATRNNFDYSHVTRNKYFVPDVKRPVHELPTDDNFFISPLRDVYNNETLGEHSDEIIYTQNRFKSDGKFTTIDPYYNDLDKIRNINDYKRYGLDERSKYAEAELDTEITHYKEDHSVTGKIERVENIGHVKRVHLAHTPVKSPTVKINKTLDTPVRRNDISPTHFNDINDEFESGTDYNKNTQIEKVPLKNFDYVQIEKEKETKVPIKQVDHFTEDKNKDLNPEIMKNQQLSGHSWRSQETSNEDKYKEIIKQIGNRNSSSTFNKIGDNRNEKLTPIATKPEHKVEVKIKENNEANKIKNILVNSESVEQENIENTSSSDSREKTSDEVQVNTMEKMLNFIKVVADTISKNTRRADGKITYLNDLKHTLLANIKDRIDATWPEETAETSRRQSRSARQHMALADPGQDETLADPGHRAVQGRSARGHVEFPSSESALMTISFLTFAVFLIKLVLQVIQTYKHKTMVMAPLMVTSAGRAVKRLRPNT